jgi:hypothetical protein
VTGRPAGTLRGVPATGAVQQDSKEEGHADQHDEEERGESILASKLDCLCHGRFALW